MQSDDRDYMARRAKQIEDMYMLRAMTGACVVTGLVLTVISLVLLSSGYGTLGSILLVVSLLFGAGALFMFVSYLAERAADRAIQKEYELLALYGQPLEKPKRGEYNDAAWVGDDGELPLEDSLDEEIRAGAHQGE